MLRHRNLDNVGTLRSLLAAEGRVSQASKPTQDSSSDTSRSVSNILLRVMQQIPATADTKHGSYTLKNIQY